MVETHPEAHCRVRATMGRWSRRGWGLGWVRAWRPSPRPTGLLGRSWPVERRCPRLTVFSGQGNPNAETRSEECLRVRKYKVDLVLPRLTPPMTPGFLTPNIPTSFLLCSQPPPPPSVWPNHPASLSRQATPPSGIFTRSPWPKDELQLAFKALCGQEYSLFSLPKPPPHPRNSVRAVTP